MKINQISHLAGWFSKRLEPNRERKVEGEGVGGSTRAETGQEQAANVLSVQGGHDSRGLGRTKRV